MKYTIIFKYLDGELFEIDIPLDKIEALMNSISKGECYFDEAKGSGIWISLDKVRYFHVEKVDEKGERVIVTPWEKENDPAWNEME